MMETCHMTERILNLTLEIIYLLTGEDYTIMNKSGGHVTLGGWNETKSPITVLPPNSLIHNGNNDLKILDLTNKIIQLLTGEVPIRCQDVTVYFSLEEWEYIEGHQDLYKDVTMEALPSVDGLKNKNTLERFPCHLYLNGCKVEDQHVLQEYQGEDVRDYKDAVLKVEEQKFMSRNQCGEENIPAHLSTVEQITRNTVEENFFSSSACKIENDNLQDSSGAHAITVNVPIVLPGADISSDLCNNDRCFVDKTDFLTYSRAHRVDKVFSCSECDKCFTHNADLIRHQKIHMCEKPFPCSECGKCFTHNADLIRHQKIHTCEKSFPCSECDKYFTHNADLIRHQKIHTCEKPFPCSECGKCFKRKSTLIDHLKIHTGEKPFPCPLCGKCFNRKSSLLGHQVMHTGKKSFQCFECGKCVSRKSILLRHQKYHCRILKSS